MPWQLDVHDTYRRVRTPLDVLRCIQPQDSRADKHYK